MSPSPSAGPRKSPASPTGIGREPVRAYYASRTLQALELLAFQNLSCPELAAALGTHPRTARRLLARLVADDYAEPTSDTRRRYRATLRTAALGRQLIAHAALPRWAAPYVADLHARTGATAHLVIPSYRGAVCVVHCHEQLAQAPEPMLQELLPAHATAAGKVLLSYRQPWRDSMLSERLQPYTDRTVTSRAEVEAAATQTRARGYAVDEGEYQPDTLAVAAPIFAEDRVPAAVALTLRTAAAPPCRGELTEHVVSTATAITDALERAHRVT